MRKYLALTALMCLTATPSFAQNSTSTGVGVANSQSAAGAVAVSGAGGQGGNSSLVVNTPANTTSTVNTNLSGTTTSNINQSGTVTSNINSRASGTTTVRSAPPIGAPSLSAAGLETCLGSASGGVSAVGFGITGGASIVDEGCQARLDSRTLASYGLKAAAVARLCQRVDIWRSMPDVCQQYWPRGMPYPNGIAYAEPVGLVAPLPPSAVMSTSGSIRVINGKTGVEGDCLNYNSTKQKCFQWAAVNPAIRIAPAKPRAKKLATAPAVAAINAAAPAVANPE
jgi:hypothetical protein